MLCIFNRSLLQVQNTTIMRDWTACCTVVLVVLLSSQLLTHRVSVDCRSVVDSGHTASCCGNCWLAVSVLTPRSTTGTLSSTWCLVDECRSRPTVLMLCMYMQGMLYFSTYSSLRVHSHWSHCSTVRTTRHCSASCVNETLLWQTWIIRLKSN